MPSAGSSKFSTAHAPSSGATAPADPPFGITTLDVAPDAAPNEPDVASRVLLLELPVGLATSVRPRTKGSAVRKKDAVLGAAAAPSSEPFSERPEPAVRPRPDLPVDRPIALIV